MMMREPGFMGLAKERAKSPKAAIIPTMGTILTKFLWVKVKV